MVRSESPRLRVLLMAVAAAGWAPRAEAVPPRAVETEALLLAGSTGGALALGGFDSSGVNLLSRITPQEFPSHSGGANDIVTYVSPLGREYAIVGLTNGTGFVDLSDPRNPVIVADVPDALSLWSDIAVYDQFAYNVTESNGGIQIIDLSRIDDGIVALVGSVTGGVNTAHNIFVNPTSGYAYPCGTNIVSGFIAYDLASPIDPQPVGQWNEESTHDLYVTSYSDCPYPGRTGACEIAFAFCGGSGLFIVDVTDKSAMTTVATLVYPDLAFAHQGWLSSDRRHLFLGDELDESRSGIPSTTYVIDVQNVADPVLLTSFTTGLPSIDHNLTVRGDFLFEANYTSGLRIFDISDIDGITEAGFFDTFPENDAVAFDGAWGVDAGLPSGIVVVSDMTGGLFVFDVTPVTGCQFDTECDDQDPCTSDVCAPSGICVSEAVAAGAACEDGDPCTIDEQCDDQGRCVGLDFNDGPPLACSEDTACFPGTCDSRSGSCVCTPCERALLPVAEAVVRPKNRYLSFLPTNPDVLTALRVTFSELPESQSACEGKRLWVDLPFEVSELGGLADQTPPTFTAAALTDEPVFVDWGSLGVLQVFDAAIVPGGLYTVEAISASCFSIGAENYSLPFRTVTGDWGDVVGECGTLVCGVPDGTVDITSDIVSILNRFGNRPGAPPKVSVDLEPNIPDQKINISDVVFALDAFRGLEYPFPGRSDCEPR